MKYIESITLIFLSSFFFLGSALAQQTPMMKYEIAPASFQHIYIDHIQDIPSKTINYGTNQYLGQVNRNGNLYGYGMFINGDGSQIVGQFRNNQLLFGITLGQSSALVGSRDYYASYSLATGRIEFVFRANERVLIDAQNQLDYGFVSMTYANGDQYVGEVYQRQRHGYGIYYYSNGDFWFGQYREDVRDGFGALFSVDGDIQVGQWRGEDEVRVIQVKKK